MRCASPSTSPSKNRAMSCRSTPSPSRSCPARRSSSSPPTIRSLIYKWTIAKPYARATAKNAAEFLKSVRAQMPIGAVQIDGGSEFMAEFEQACADAKIPLYVLPPRSPKLNGAVERCNGVWRYEFYACSDLPLDSDKIADRVDAFQHLYNNHRPHGALAGMTPTKYLSIRPARKTHPPHMC